MLVGQNDVVQVARDGHFIVGEIAEPGSVTVVGVRQHGEDLIKLNGNGVTALTAFERRDFVRLWPEVNSQSWLVHSVRPC